MTLVWPSAHTVYIAINLLQRVRTPSSRLIIAYSSSYSSPTRAILFGPSGHSSHQCTVHIPDTLFSLQGSAHSFFPVLRIFLVIEKQCMFQILCTCLTQ